MNNLKSGYLTKSGARRLGVSPCRVWYMVYSDAPEFASDIWRDHGGQPGERIGGCLDVADLNGEPGGAV